MNEKYPEHKQLDLPTIEKNILKKWRSQNIFKQSLEAHKDHKPFVFYEGPPSANGMPGIHHLLSRAIKDTFCRYKTLQGFFVDRRAGWDTHGLPVELAVEKELGLKKEDIGEKISVEEFNRKCRESVMRFTSSWEEITEKMGYWVDMERPYVTYHAKYMETVWWLLGELYRKNLLYKGYTIQPFSPMAGTGLSSHELNQPGCYRLVKDTTVVAQFKIDAAARKSSPLFKNITTDLYFIAWTTTPWTLPSNTALCVNKNFTYVTVQTFNRYTSKPIAVILAKELMGHYFKEFEGSDDLSSYKEGDKNIPFKIIGEMTGAALEGTRYEQLLPYVKPTEGDAFKVVCDDFVTTESGTGIVHIAPSFGADDYRVAKAQGIGTLTLVDRTGRFVKEVTDYPGHCVKQAFENPELRESQDYVPVDVKIAIKLKEQNQAFLIEKYEHTYPHCWRTDAPIIYYPMDSWFIKTTAMKDKLIANNLKINWKPEATGKGRFGNWLENLVDWNLSRSRYWGIPLPIWTTADKSEQKIINSIGALKAEIDKSVARGFMATNYLKDFKENDFSEANYLKADIHRPYVDDVILVSDSGKEMRRETDIIDVWFDSGAMPYAQLHYPFENKDIFDKNFPADFIAEGVDQTRGWFFTLHAIASLLFDDVAYKNVVSNGLILDKNGQKMSKRLGNTIDPFALLDKYGGDAVRWYILSNGNPWDNLKFDPDGVAEVSRKLFGTLLNTYAFFALYANIDGFAYKEAEIPHAQRSEMDRWILSELHSLISRVTSAYDDYEPTKVARDVEQFCENLSNWYIRLSRRRFWKGEYNNDKIAAYQTLYQCLEKLTLIMAPIAPFLSDHIFSDLNQVSQRTKCDSIHLAQFPKALDNLINKDLEECMAFAQDITTVVLALREKEKLRVRQPLRKILMSVASDKIMRQVESVKYIILSETNLKEINFLDPGSSILVRKLKPDFKKLGPKLGKDVKEVATLLSQLPQSEIQRFDREGALTLVLSDKREVSLSGDDVEISFSDIPGLSIGSSGKVTIALDITVDRELRLEGIARELVNRIQNIRKKSGLEVTDRIKITLSSHGETDEAINTHRKHICEETLADQLNIVDGPLKNGQEVVFDEIKIFIAVEKS